MEDYTGNHSPASADNNINSKLVPVQELFIGPSKVNSRPSRKHKAPIHNESSSDEDVQSVGDCTNTGNEDDDIENQSEAESSSDDVMRVVQILYQYQI